MTPNTKPTVAFVGLGAMGFGMAQSLLRAGFSVTGYDISPQARERFTHAGGKSVSALAGVADQANILIIMVLNAQQVESILFGADGVGDRLQPGTLVMLSSTVQPAYAESLATRLAERAIELLDAPVSGGTARAADGALSIMASGSESAFTRAQSILDALAQQVYRMGEKPGLGSTMKMVNQVLAGIHLAASAEALALGARAGLDPNAMYEVICNSAGGSWIFENRVPHILADDYTPHSAIEIWLKDLGLVVDTGKELHLPTPLSAAAQQLFVMAAALGHARLDDAAVIKVYEQLANFRVMADTGASPTDAPPGPQKE